MKRIKCEEVIISMIEEAERQDSTKVKNLAAFEMTKFILKDVDSLIEEVRSSGFDAFIDKEDNIHVSIICEEIEIMKSNHIFYRIARMSSTFGFFANDNYEIVAKFAFPGVWK